MFRSFGPIHSKFSILAIALGFVVSAPSLGVTEDAEPTSESDHKAMMDDEKVARELKASQKKEIPKCDEDCTKQVAEADAKAARDVLGFDGKVNPKSDPSCYPSAERARKACFGSEINATVQPFINTFTASLSGDQNKACRMARTIAAITTAANITLAMSCGKLKNSCVNTCRTTGKKNQDNVSVLMAAQQVTAANSLAMRAAADFQNVALCQKYESNVQTAVLQSAMSAITFAQSDQCVKLTNTTPTTQPEAACTTSAAFENAECPQWCLVPGRQEDAKCKIAVPTMPQCSDPVYAENPMCKMPGGPEPYTGGGGTPYVEPGGGGSGGGIGTGGESRGNTSLGNGNLGIGDLPELPPGDAPMTPVQKGNDQTGSNAGAGGGGSGVGGGFSGGGSGGGAPSGEGTEKASNKEVFVPLTNAPGGSDSMMSSEGGDGDGGPGPGLATDDASGTPPFDLSKFLPKDMQDRMPASDPTLAANGISDANGLSNWEKVTRKMNEKRGELKP